MKHSIRGTVGSRGAVQATLVTNMESGRSKVSVSVGIAVDIDTAQLPTIEQKWDRITDLRDEFDERLKNMLLPPNVGGKPRE